MPSIFGSCAPVSATPGLCYVSLTKPLGPVLHEKGGLTAIDLDVAEGQTLSPVQLSIIANFNSYTEISASGRGVHVFALGSFGKGLRHASVEIYSQGRFMALTGNHYGEPRALAERQEYLDQLVHEMRGGKSRLPHTTKRRRKPDPTTKSLLPGTRQRTGKVQDAARRTMARPIRIAARSRFRLYLYAVVSLAPSRANSAFVSRIGAGRAR